MINLFLIFFKYLSKNNFEKINLLFRIPLIELIVLKSISFMSENLNSNNIENDEFNLINEDSDYKDLITRLNEIKSNIVLLEKTIFK